VTPAWPQGKERPNGIIGAFSDTNTNTFEGHAFRMRTATGGLLMEYTARKSGRMSFDTGEAVVISGCGDHKDDFPLWDAGRDKEFEALSHDHAAPCVGPSKAWSCVKYYSRVEHDARNRSLYGFAPGEVPPKRQGVTFDTSYTAQIGKVPKITPLGAGYHKMTMTAKLKELLTEWYHARKLDSMKDHGVIAGGYTNNDVVKIDKVGVVCAVGGVRKGAHRAFAHQTWPWDAGRAICRITPPSARVLCGFCAAQD